VARIAVVGNASRDVNRVKRRSLRRPGGTVLYASLALTALGHDVVPIGHAPPRAYAWLKRAVADVSHLHVAVPGTQFLNEYENEHRRQWARRGPELAIRDESGLDGADAVLLGPVLGEVPDDVRAPAGVPSLLDLQGRVRRVGERNLRGWRPITVEAGTLGPTGTDHVHASADEVHLITGETDLEAALRTLGASTRSTPVVTLGALGAIAFDGEMHRCRPERLVLDDPTGAGDVFDAGFLHAVVQGCDLGTALAWGCATAGHFLERRWTRDPLERFASAAEVERRAATMA